VSLLGLAVASAFLSGLADRVSPRIKIPKGFRRAARVAGAGAAAAAILAAAVAGPSFVGQATAAFRSSPGADADDLGERLFTISGNGRSDYWSVAWSEYTDHPVLGSGAGTYELYWTANRPNWFGARDAHNLYLETLAELGPVGLLLLLALLATPIVAFAIGRRTGLSALALAAYVAYLAHAAIDWDWEVPAVTLAALFCGTGVVIAARAGRTYTLRGHGRAAALGIAVLLGALAFVTAIGNGAVAASERATARGQLAKAETEARKATRWAPWSAEAWLTLGRAQIDRGLEEAARASFTQGLRRDRADWRLWLELALASEGSDRRSAFEEVRRLNPRSPELAALGES